MTRKNPSCSLKNYSKTFLKFLRTFSKNSWTISKFPWTFFAFSMALIFSQPAQGQKAYTFLQWNVWQEGTVVEGGYEALVDEIVRLRPDFVTLSEVRNYHDTSFARRIEKSLSERGEKYYSFYSYDSGLLSRYPLSDSLTVFPCEGDHGSVYRLTCEARGVKWAVYTAHLDYQNCTYYDIRGYDGNTWRERPSLCDSAEVMRLNALSRRDEAITAFLAQAARDEAEGYVIALGGDFNEPSCLDWTAATRFTRDHRGLIIPWPATARLAEAGYADAWRTVFPNPLTHPGFTYPADNPALSPLRLTWAPQADERERIDYLFFKGAGIAVSDCRLFGPRGCILYGRRAASATHEPLIEPQGVWPTDHKGVWAEIRVE